MEKAHLDLLPEAIAFTLIDRDFEKLGQLGSTHFRAQMLSPVRSVRGNLLRVHWQAQLLAEEWRGAGRNAADWTDPVQLADMIDDALGRPDHLGHLAFDIMQCLDDAAKIRVHFERRKEKRRRLVQYRPRALVCLACGADLPEPKNPGNPAKFCSTRCRVNAHRASSRHP